MKMNELSKYTIIAIKMKILDEHYDLYNYLLPAPKHRVEMCIDGYIDASEGKL